MCGWCIRVVYLWYIYAEGCIRWLVGAECPTRRFKDRDEGKWVVQKWEEV